MIDFTIRERKIILSAIKLENERISKFNSDSDTIGIFEDELENLRVIESEITKDIILLSRNQLDSVGEYLGSLMDNDLYEQLEISALEDKINAMTDLD